MQASTMPVARTRPPCLMTEMIETEPALAERVIRRLAGDRTTATVAQLREAAAR